MAGICWLASYPKSGNTWVRAFLANLFSGPGLAEKPVPIDDLSKYVIADDFYSRYQPHSQEEVETLSAEALLQLRARVHDGFASASANTIFVKSHNAAIAVAGVPLISPSATAGAIYIARNPLDVAVSYADHFQLPLESAVAQLCDPANSLPPGHGLMRRYLGSWSGHVKSWTRAPGMHRCLIRYEDMTAAPIETFSEVVKFLGLPADRPRLERAIEFSSFRELKKQEAAGGFQEARPDGKARFFRQGKKGSWRDALSEEQARHLIDAHGEVMLELGYLTQGGELTI